MFMSVRAMPGTVCGKYRSLGQIGIRLETRKCVLPK